MRQKSWLLCKNQIHQLDLFHISHYLQRLSVDRLDQKTIQFIELFEEVKNHLEDTFYHSLCYCMGLKLNSDVFLKLSKRLPISIIKKHQNNLMQVEAMLFGTAGFLNDVKDHYGYTLKKEFEFLKYKYSIEELDESEWTFLRLRPTSFPTIRLAQLAKLLTAQPNIFSKILDCSNYLHLKKLFQIKIDDGYWLNHYHLKKPSAKRTKSLGNQWLNTLIINSICPLLFIYAKRKGQFEFQERSLNLLQEIDAENNVITRQFQKFGVTPRNASESQGLLQLKTAYCDAKKCLNCNIGSKLLS